MKQHDKWTSADIADYSLRKERAEKSKAHWADLRSGDMYLGEERKPHGFGFAVGVVVCVMFWATVYLAIMAIL